MHEKYHSSGHLPQQLMMQIIMPNNSLVCKLGLTLEIVLLIIPEGLQQSLTCININMHLATGTHANHRETLSLSLSLSLSVSLSLSPDDSNMTT